MRHENKHEKLTELLNKVQKETKNEEFIYGVTDRTKRSITQKLNDFFIDRSHVPVTQKAYFFELLATLIHAGIPLNAALKILISKTENRRLRRVIATISYELEHGRPLSAALERFPNIFQDTERGVVKSAEAVGNLEQTLLKLASNLEKRNELMMRLKGALVYPLAVCAALMVGLVVMLVFVVPRIQSIFAESKLSLPLPTRILLGSSVIVTRFWWLGIILILFGIVAFHLYSHSEMGRFSLDFHKLRIPIFGGILRKLFVIRFVGTLGLLVESGLPINQALEYTANAVGNEVYRIKTYEALAHVQEGKSLSSALSSAPFLFPETVTNMIAVGERSASIGDISQKISAHFEREIDYTLKNMTTVLGPLLILVIGVTVAFFALAVLSPIFSLTQAVQ